jgi:hypothetical protein
MRLYSDSMDKLYSGFKEFFERREYLDRIALARQEAYSPSVESILHELTTYYKKLVTSNRILTGIEAVEEITDFLRKYKIRPAPAMKEAAFRELASLDRKVER